MRNRKIFFCRVVQKNWRETKTFISQERRDVSASQRKSRRLGGGRTRSCSMRRSGRLCLQPRLNITVVRVLESGLGICATADWPHCVTSHGKTRAPRSKDVLEQRVACSAKNKFLSNAANQQAETLLLITPDVALDRTDRITMELCSRDNNIDVICRTSSSSVIVLSID